MAIQRARHRISGVASDDALVVRGPHGDPLVLDDLTFDEARHWHHTLLEQHEPHVWRVNDGGRTGWNSVAAGYYVTTAERAAVPA